MITVQESLKGGQANNNYYCIAGYFRGVQFSWLTGDLWKLSPQNNQAYTMYVHILTLACLCVSVKIESLYMKINAAEHLSMTQIVLDPSSISHYAVSFPLHIHAPPSIPSSDPPVVTIVFILVEMSCTHQESKEHSTSREEVPNIVVVIKPVHIAFLIPFTRHSCANLQCSWDTLYTMYINYLEKKPLIKLIIMVTVTLYYRILNLDP